MLVVWAVYILSISTVLVALAWPAERALRRRKKATRFLWASAFLGSVLSPILGGVLVSVRDLFLAERIELARTLGTPNPAALYTAEDVLRDSSVAGIGINALFLGFWLATAAIAAGWIWLSRRSAKTISTSWRPTTWRGHSVYRSQATGPCVAGFIRPRLVIPDWVDSLTERQQELVLQHELEHVRVWDPRLSQIFLGLICLMPWNLPLIVAYRRLRLAIEIDCDRRVVGQSASLREYGEALLEAQSQFPRYGLGFFQQSELEHRIRSLSGQHSGWRLLEDGLVVFGAMTALAAFLLVPIPRMEVLGLKTVLGRSTPKPTPYDVPPTVLNTEAFETQFLRLQALARGRDLDRTQVTFLLHITDSGIVDRALLGISSGDREIDFLARRIVVNTKWDPALKDGIPTDVWVNFNRLRWNQNSGRAPLPP